MNGEDGASARLRALIVDDETHGRDVVRHMLQKHPDVMVVGEASNGARALDDVRTLHPDLVFLDIRMPRLDGIEMVDALGEDAPPVIVFTTAHDAYAVEAFDRCAFDYLLKPFDQERFDRTMSRVRERLRSQGDAEFGRRLREVLGTHVNLADATGVERSRSAESGKSERLNRFVIRDAGRVHFVPVESADWLEASGNYVGVHVGVKTHLVHQTLSELERALDPQAFLRIHRSTIVNIARIRELETLTNGEFIVVLRDGTRLKLSRSFRGRADVVLKLG